MYANATNKDKVLFKELSYEICGLCFKIHNELGRFRSEKQYADAFEGLLKEGNWEYKREFALPISFVGENNRRNILDFIVSNEIILDLKAKTFIEKEDYFQMKRYLTSANKKLGIIINFRQRYLSPKRVINTDL
ncbi:MAG: GxxExxY protein [Candidatus Yanofskybacteria bacterium]|nr:GxxExxY protein [Candidatus Yanofskybacteria bacterium]